MNTPLDPQREQKAQELAARIRQRAADDILCIARTLVSTTDETLFGETEFQLRDHARTIVGHAYAEHLPQKVATTPPPNPAPADTPPPSTATAKKPSKRSAGR